MNEHFLNGRTATREGAEAFEMTVKGRQTRTRLGFKTVRKFHRKLDDDASTPSHNTAGLAFGSPVNLVKKFAVVPTMRHFSRGIVFGAPCVIRPT